MEKDLVLRSLPVLDETEIVIENIDLPTLKARISMQKIGSLMVQIGFDKMSFNEFEKSTFECRSEILSQDEFLKIGKNMGWL